MPRTASEVKRLAEAQGIKWTPELRAYAIANGAVDDSAPSNANLAPNLLAELMSVPNAFLSGATAQLSSKTNPVYESNTRYPWLNTTMDKVVNPTAYGLGMALPISKISKAISLVAKAPQALSEGGLLARMAARALEGAPAFSAYEGARGAIEGYRNATGTTGLSDLVTGEAPQPTTWDRIRGMLVGAEQGVVSGATTGAAMSALKIPERLGGDYTGAGLGLGALTAVEGGSIPDIAGATVAGPIMHALGVESRTGAGQRSALRLLDRAEAAKAEKTKILNDLLAEQYAQEQANQAFAEAGSRVPEVFVGEKGKIRQIPVRVTPKEYKAAKAKLAEQGAYQAGELVPGERPGSMVQTPLSLSDKAALELMDAPPDARTAPYEGPKVPVAVGERGLLPERPGQIRPAEDRIPPDSQDARSEMPPPEAPVVPPAPEPPAPPEQGAPVEPSAPKPKRRPGKKKAKADEGDVTLGTMGGGLEQIKKVFRRPGQRKAAEEKRPGVKKDNILAAAFLPTEVQIARQSPEARKVAEMLHAGKYEPKQSGGRFARALVEYRASSMTPDESVSIGQAIQGFRAPETLTPKARKLMDVTRRYLKEVAIKSGGVDMKLYTASGKRVEFPGPNEKFFPHIPVKTEDLKVGGKARERVIKNAVAIRAFETEAEAGEMLDSYVDIAESGMHARNKKMAERLMERGKADTVEEAVNLIKGNRKNNGPERFGSLEYAREFDNPFYEPDFKAMTQYSREAERRIAETKTWGQDNERLKEAIAQIHSDSERKGVALTAETAKGIVQPGSKPIDDAAIVMRRFGSYMMSPLSAIRNTGQVDNSFLLTDFKSVIKAINLNRESRLRAIESGSTSGPVLHDVEMGKGGAPSYQKIIGQTGTEVLLRTHANNAGMNYFHDYVDRIRKNPNDAFAAKELRKMGQDPADLATGRELTRTDYNKAGFNIAARGQFMYDELDVPAWFNATQPGKTVSQFRPWIVQQSHLIYDETVGQWKGGTTEGKMRCLRNIGLLATLYPLRGEVLNDVVALLQGKKRTSNLYLRYLEDAAQMGVLTVISDLYNAVQYNNAEGLMMGASMSKAKDMAKIAGSLAKNGKLSYSEQRLVFRMVPIIGPLFAYRLFPKQERGGATSGRVPPKKVPAKKVPGKKRPGQKKAPRN